MSGLPPLTRWFLRTALLWLLLGLLLGIVVVLPNGPGSLYPPLVHLLAVGWVTQTIFGVAWWMFPRPAPDRSHGPAAMGWAGYVALNAGLLLRLWAEPAAQTGAALPVGLLALSGVLQLLAVAILGPVLWRRAGGT